MPTAIPAWSCDCHHRIPNLRTTTFEECVDEHQGISHAEVITAVPLSDDEKRTVEEKLSELTGTKVIARLEVQPEIVGGLLARVGDRLIDGSTRGRLLALRGTLMEQER